MEGEIKIVSIITDEWTDIHLFINRDLKDFQMAHHCAEKSIATRITICFPASTGKYIQGVRHYVLRGFNMLVMQNIFIPQKNILILSQTINKFTMWNDPCS